MLDYGRSGLGVVRALARSGYRAIAGRSPDRTSTYHVSRAAATVWHHPSLDRDATAFLAALDELLAQRTDIRIVFPVSQQATVFFAAHGHRLRNRVALATPSPEVVRTCIDKACMAELIETLEIPTVATAVADNLESLRSKRNQLGYPCIVKPVDTNARIAGKKAIICTSDSDFDLAFESWPAAHTRLLMQRLFLGQRHNLYFAAKNGEILAAVEIAVQRTNRLDDTGLAVDVVTVPPTVPVHRHTTSLVSRLGYTGVGCAQFLVDRVSGEVCFLEINPRLGANHAVTRAAGLDLAMAAIRLADDQKLDELEGFTYPVGLRCAWTIGDLQGFGVALGEREIGAGEALRWLVQMGGTFLGADCHVTWSWRDPVPTLAELARAFKQGILDRDR